MKNFIKNIVLISGILTLCAFFLDMGYTRVFTQGISRNEVQYAYNLKNTHVDYIFLGSSRVENHIDCDLVTQLTGKSCLNLGIQGSKIGDALGLAQILQANNMSYNTLFFQLDYNYNYTFITPSVVSYAAPFINESGFPKEFREQMKVPALYELPFMRYAANDKMVGIRELILQLVKKPPAIDLSNGFDPKEGIGQNISGGFPNKLIEENAQLDALKSIAGDRLVLFTAPYCKNTTNREEFMELLQSREPSLRSYIDLFDDKPKYFSNCGHLNKEGAQAFTTTITQTLNLDK